MKRCGSIEVLFAAIFFLVPLRTPAQDMVVGVNVVNRLRASVTDQDALLSQAQSGTGARHPLRYIERRQGHRFRKACRSSEHSDPIDRWPAIHAQRAIVAESARYIPRHVGRTSALFCCPCPLQNGRVFNREHSTRSGPSAVGLKSASQRNTVLSALARHAFVPGLP